MPGYESIGKEELDETIDVFKKGGILFRHGFDNHRKCYKVQEFEIRQLNIGDKIDVNKGQIKSKNAIIKTISNNYLTAELIELGMTIVLKKTDLLL